MPRVLIVHASRHGGSAGIAERVGAVLEDAGVSTVVARAAEMPDPQGFDGCVVGAGVYMGSWVKDGTDYLERFADPLARMPVWLFSSGPLPGSSKESAEPVTDPIENALGPAEGPGSGGRRKVEALAARIEPRDHHVFQGRFDPTDSPKTLAERLIRILPASKDILPTGDFREWPLIEAWAREIATQLRVPGALPGPESPVDRGTVPVGSA
jgi:menaquinone-dependent protoporphyrinogen oxidase